MSSPNNNLESDSDMQTFHAQCHCKKQTFSFQIAKKSLPLETDLCHCDDDRKVTGLMALDYLLIKEEISKDLFDPSNPPKGLRSFCLTKKLVWWFCETCGCHLVQHTARTDEEREKSENKNVQWNWYVSTGIVYPSLMKDGGRVWDRKRHIYVKPGRDQGGLARIMPDGLPRYPGHWHTKDEKGEEMLKPLSYSETYSESEFQPTKEERGQIEKWENSKTLPFSCACGYVQLTLLRPIEHGCADERFKGLRDPTEQKWQWKICPCNSCRTTTGFEGGVGILFPSFHHIQSNIEIKNQSFLQGYDETLLEGDPNKPATRGLVLYRSSDRNNRRFCPCCGASVFIDFEGPGPEICDLFLGLVDAPLRAVFSSWSFPSQKLGFLDFCRDRKLANQLNQGFCPGIDCTLPDEYKSKVHRYQGELDIRQ